MRFPRALAGLVIFAVTLAAIEYAFHRRVSSLAIRTVAIGCASVWLFHALPWRRWFSRLRPGSASYRAGLSLIFLWHFTHVLEEEAWRLYAARRMAVRREFGPRGFTSLVYATASLFQRTLTRAERFHAGLLVREIEP